MARRRRPGSRTSVGDGQPRIIIPVDAISDPDGAALTFESAIRFLQPADSYPATLRDADAANAVVLDRFAWDLHLGDLGHATDTHDGDTFFDAASSAGTVAVYVVRGIDPRRSTPEEIDAAARAGDLAAALISSYPVDVLQS